MRRNFRKSPLGASSEYKGLSGETVYKKWHWGLSPSMAIEVDDDDLPDELVETGRLAEIYYFPVRGKAKRKDKALKLPKKASNDSYLTFDPSHSFHRLYIVLDKDFQKKMKKEFWTENRSQDTFIPSEIAHQIGGKHATDDYPLIDVKPIGIITAIVYACEKEGDGFSLYIHHMGEETGIRPALGCDEVGRLWIIGGDYSAPIPGITN